MSSLPDEFFTSEEDATDTVDANAESKGTLVDVFDTSEDEPCAKSMPVKAKKTPRAKSKRAAMAKGKPTATAEPTSTSDAAASLHQQQDPIATSSMGKRSMPHSANTGSAKRLAESMPDNGGAFAYARWVVAAKMDGADIDSLAKLSGLTVGSFCSGMCTESLAFEAIRRALPHSQSLPAVRFEFVCESNREKLNLLKTQHPHAIHIVNAADLVGDVVEDCEGKVWDQPQPAWIIAGLSCKCLSNLNHTPKSVIGDGPTGNSVRALLNYVESIPFANRPQVVTIEEVSGLLQNRKCEVNQKSGMHVLVDSMDRLGYTAKWAICNSRQYGVPQQRERVWAHFYLRPAAKQDVKTAELIAGMMHNAIRRVAEFTTTPEPLGNVMDKLGDEAFRNVKPHDSASKPVSAKTAKANRDFMAQRGILASDLDKLEKLRPYLTNLISERAAAVTLVKLAATVKKEGWRWESDTLVLTAGASVSYMKVWKDAFPNLLPSSPFLVVSHGTPYLASGKMHLAVQGVQSAELGYMRLNALPDEKLRDLAGNAFTANVCTAVLSAAMLELLSGTKATVRG